MKYEIRVVSFDGQKMFECKGIKILLDRWYFGDDFCRGVRATITIYRDGQVYDSGEWGRVPGRDGLNLKEFAITGLKRKDWNGDHDYAYGFRMQNLQVGDMIAVETAKRLDPLYSVFADYLYGWWPRTKMFRERFPYRGLTRPRKNAKALRRTWNKRIRFLRRMLKCGEMPYLDFTVDQSGRRRPRYRPNRPRKIMRLAVVRRAGRNYFFYDDCYFDNVNAWLIPDRYGAHVRIMREGKVFTSGYLGGLGKTGDALGFEGFDALKPTGDQRCCFWFENLRADMLLRGDTVELESDEKWDLLDGVIQDYCHSRLANARVKRIRRHYPTEKQIEKMAQGDYCFETSLCCAAGWELIERVRRFVRERKIVFMRFEKRKR